MEPKRKYTIGPDVDLNKTIIRDKNGRRITNRRAEKMAKQAIAEVIRRQELSGESVKSPQAKLRLRLKLRRLLKKEAKRCGETKSAIVREALEKYSKSA